MVVAVVVDVFSVVWCGPMLVEAMHERYTHTHLLSICDQHVLCLWAFVAHLRIAWVTASRSAWSW